MFTQQQFAELRNKGLSVDQIVELDKKNSAPKKDFLQKTGDVVNKVFPGKQLGTAIGNSIYGIGQKLKGNDEGYREAANDNSKMVKRVAGDTLKIGATLAGAALPIKPTIAGKALQFGKIGAASGAGEAMSQDQGLKKTIGKAIGGGIVGAGTGAALGVAEKAIKGFGKLSEKAGDRIQTSVIKPSQADIKDGFSIDTVKKYNLGGSLKNTFTKTDKQLDTLTKELNKKLTDSNTALDLNKVYENTAKRLLGGKLENFGTNSQMENAIEKLRSEITQVSGQNGMVSIPEAQIIKRASGHYGAWTFGNPTPEATAQQKVYNTFYNEIKTAIEKNSPEGVKELNQEISKLIPVMNAVIRRIPIAERNSAISLTDIITLAASALEPRALAVSLLNFASKRGSVGKVLSNVPQVTNAISRGVEKTEPVVRTMLGR